MLVNKKKDMTPFDMKRPPMKQKWYLMPLLWGGSWLMTRRFGLKIHKMNMKNFKPPYLVLSTHQGFSDYYIAPLALFPHRANYVSDMEGFAAFGEWLYRAIGCIGKRRYVSDYSVVKNIKLALKDKQSVVIFPESRHSNVGTTAYLPENLGKLVKSMGVPLVILSVHGSYLANPFWDEEHTRRTPMEATLEGVYTTQEVLELSAQEIQKTIEEKLQYDEYKWQRENQIPITEKNRAEGLHKALYQCKACKSEYCMKSKGSQLYCEKCGAKWEMTELGMLQRIAIPDWYEWQRAEVIRQIEQGGYEASYVVTVEALPNAKGFVPLGEGRLIHREEGFTLEVGQETLVFEHATRESVQTEYNYRHKGMGIVLSTRDCCYYIYSKDVAFQPTKIQFVGEYFYKEGKRKSESKGIGSAGRSVFAERI